MSLSDYVAGMEGGLIKTLFTLLDKFMTMCTVIANYFDATLREVIVNALQRVEIHEDIVKAINEILEGPWAFIYNISLGDILLGGALLFVIVFGIVKYFTDIVF